MQPIYFYTVSTLFAFIIGADKYGLELHLPDDEAGDILSTRHLAQEVEKSTGVPIAKQKLIFKGEEMPMTLSVTSFTLYSFITDPVIFYCMMFEGCTYLS